MEERRSDGGDGSVPVLATRIAGATGLLGEDHPGLFEAGDARALAGLIERAEEDAGFLEELARRSRERAWRAEPARELASWRALLAELLPDSCRARGRG